MDLFKDNAIVNEEDFTWAIVRKHQAAASLAWYSTERWPSGGVGPAVACSVVCRPGKVDLLLHDLLTYWPEQQTWHCGVTLVVLVLCSPAAVGQSAPLCWEHLSLCPLISTY